MYHVAMNTQLLLLNKLVTYTAWVQTKMENLV